MFGAAIRRSGDQNNKIFGHFGGWILRPRRFPGGQNWVNRTLKCYEKTFDTKILPNWRFFATLAQSSQIGDFGDISPIWRNFWSKHLHMILQMT